MTYFTHRYSNTDNLTEYEVVVNYPDGSSHVSDQHNEDEWIALDPINNIPAKVSGNRFITIVEGVVTVDPDMEDILIAEAEAQAIIDAAHAEKLLAIQDLKDAYNNILDDIQGIVDANTTLQGYTTDNINTQTKLLNLLKNIGNNIETVAIIDKKIVRYLYNDFMNGY